MPYDLLIKNGRIVDGSGMPAFRRDTGVREGKIVELGKLSGPARRTIDAKGRVVIARCHRGNVRLQRVCAGSQ